MDRIIGRNNIDRIGRQRRFLERTIKVLRPVTVVRIVTLIDEKLDKGEREGEELRRSWFAIHEKPSGRWRNTSVKHRFPASDIYIIKTTYAVRNLERIS